MTSPGPAPLAQPQDVAAFTGDSYTGAAEVRVRTVLRYISNRIRNRRPDIDTWLADGTIGHQFVADVVASAAARGLDALERGVGVVSETHPEYSYRLSEAAAAGVAGITAQEWADLLPVSKRPRGAFSITPG